MKRRQTRERENFECRMCGRKNETLEHTCECEETKVEIREELVEGMKKWRNEEAGNKLRRKLTTCLRVKPILDFCNYVKEFERLERNHEQGECKKEKCKKSVNKSDCER